MFPSRPLIGPINRSSPRLISRPPGPDRQPAQPCYNEAVPNRRHAMLQCQLCPRGGPESPSPPERGYRLRFRRLCSHTLVFPVHVFNTLSSSLFLLVIVQFLRCWPSPVPYYFPFTSTACQYTSPVLPIFVPPHISSHTFLFTLGDGLF